MSNNNSSGTSSTTDPAAPAPRADRN
jgi:hypothetical protein